LIVYLGTYAFFNFMIGKKATSVIPPRHGSGFLFDPRSDDIST
jgi:hypothetical protein